MIIMHPAYVSILRSWSFLFQIMSSVYDRRRVLLDSFAYIFACPVILHFIATNN